jgi:hypothetical protein
MTGLWAQVAVALDAWGEGYDGHMSDQARRGMVDSMPRGVVGDLRSRHHERLRYAVDAVANRPWALGR